MQFTFCVAENHTDCCVFQLKRSLALSGQPSKNNETRPVINLVDFQNI